jgi:hypothetical protein
MARQALAADTPSRNLSIRNKNGDEALAHDGLLGLF